MKSLHLAAVAALTFLLPFVAAPAADAQAPTAAEAAKLKGDAPYRHRRNLEGRHQV